MRVNIKIKVNIYICVFIFGSCIINVFAETPEPGLPAMLNRPKTEYDAKTYKDPFLGPASSNIPVLKNNKPSLKDVPKTLPSFTVQGLIWGGRIPQAIINNKLVTIGDTVEDATITGIDENGVTVIFAGNQYYLKSLTAEMGIHKN